MKIFFFRILFLYLLFGFLNPASFAQIWSENFNTYPDATTNAPPFWTSVATDCDDAGINLGAGQSQWGVWAGKFTINDIEGAPCCVPLGGGNDNYWLSQSIVISGYCNVSISLTTSGTGVFECDSPPMPFFGCAGTTPPDNSHDQIVAYYSLDGGPFQQFAYVCGANGLGVLSVSGLNGATLQIKVSAANKANAEFFYFDDVVVNGTAYTTPAISGIPASICQSASSIALPTTQSGITGNWSGTGVSANNFNPAGLSGIITLTFTPNAGQCANSTTTTITVNTPVTPAISGIPANICSLASPISLPTTQSGITGSWSGLGVSGNNFDPSGLNGTITLTFTPNAGQCANIATTTITVDTPVIPTITGIPASLCESDLPIALPTTQSGITGTWSGQGVSGNNFDPAGLNGNITLTFTPNAPQCADPANTSITVNAPVTPAISGIPANLCENASPISLPTTQSGIVGNWSGTGVSANNFNPSGLSGNITLTFTPTAGQCANVATTIITVNTPVTPSISGIPASLCANASQISLPTTQSGITGNWSGLGVSANNFNPSGLSGNITLTFTPNAGQCANVATTIIMVNTPVTPSISGIPASLCANASPISLPTTQSGITGNWSGTGVSANNFNPSGLSGNITLTFTPDAGQCANVATTIITVNTPVTPSISGIPASLCADASPISLPTTQSGITGNWSGPGVSANNFNPLGLSGNITLTFTPTAGQCANSATSTITVNTPVTPVISGLPSSLCETASPISLPTIQGGINGNWSGQGVSANSFDPFGLSGNITLTFTPTAGQCANSATSTISVNTPVTPVITGIPLSLCENASPVSLPTVQSGITGNWSGLGVSANNFDPFGLSGNIVLNFTPDPGQCADPASTSIDISTTPVFNNLMEDCNLLDMTYTVSFNISGGNPGTYTVNGIPVAGSFYISAPILSGSGYVFNLDDGNDCGPVVISGSVNCLCATFAGTMNFANTPLQICDGSGFTVFPDGNQLLDVDDVLEYILHTDPGAQLGTVLAISPSPTFIYPGNIVLGQTYYVSAVAGTNNGSGGVNLNDPCLSVSQGVPVIFYVPTAVISQGGTICENDCFNFQVQFTGFSPFTFIYAVNAGGNVSNDSISSNSNTASFTICPATYGVSSGQIQISPVNLTDNHCSFDISMPPVQTLTIHPNSVNSLTPVLCPNGSITVNGTVYSQSKPSGTEVLQNANVNGCDSTINVSLSFYAPSVINLTQTLCTGGSITVNGTVYNQAHPSGTEVLQNANVHGCDSTINVSLMFNSVVTYNLNARLCPGRSIIVNGTIYNAGHPSGTETFIGGSYLGCDSVVIINLSFFPPSFFNLTQALCTGGSVTVNGNVYNQANPTGTEILHNASAHGCDSTVNVNLTFSNLVTNNLNQTLCPGGSIVVNGNTYNAAHPSGSETFIGGSFMGCDSVVNVNLSFYQPAVFNLSQTFCTGGSITVNGTLYNQANPIGIEILNNASSNGCDSMINVSLNFNSISTTNLNQKLCPGGWMVVNGTTYNAANPTGSETFTGGNYLGCDSIVNINLTFYPPVTFMLDSTLQPGQTVIVNGAVYGQSNPSGMEVIMGGSSNGCDSIVIINLTYANVFVLNVSIVSPACRGGNDGAIFLEGINGGLAPFTVILDGGTPNPVVAFPFTFSGLRAGLHKITIQDGAGTLVMQDVVIPDPAILTVNLGNDRTILFGENAILTAQASFPVAIWSWMPPTFLDCTDCSNPTALMPSENITYTLTASDVNGCTAEDDVTLFITRSHDVYVPTVFSPNGDGLNDILTVYGLNNIIQIKSFQIFNRWGNLLLKSEGFLPNDLTKGWDGTFKEKKMNVGVYVWVAEVEFDDGHIEIFKGDVTLVR